MSMSTPASSALRATVAPSAPIEWLSSSAIAAPVGDDKAVEAPLLAQNLSQHEGIGAGGNAVDGIEGTHHGCRAGLDRGAIGLQIDLPQHDLAHIHGVVIAAGNGRAVGGKVLHADGDRVRLGKIALLIALDPGAGHRRTQIGILARRLNDASPTRVAGNIHHRRKDPGDAIGAGFHRASMRHRLGR